MTKHALEGEFLELLNRCQGTILRLCMLYTDRQPDSINDLYQDIASALWESWSTYRGKSKHNTWVTGVALNTARKYLEHRKRMPQFVELRDSLCYHLADEASDPLYQTLYELIDSLDNDNDREIMYLYLANKKYSEIARETGTTESAVKQRIYRIKKKLKQLNEQRQ
jgi:RNA polymerase sigma-70 factor (ECF subfamily)